MAITANKFFGEATELTLSSNLQLATYDPRVIALDVTAANKNVFMPPANALPRRAGGPHFILLNVGTFPAIIRSWGINFIAMLYPDMAGIVVMESHASKPGIWWMQSKIIKGGPPPYGTTTASDTPAGPPTEITGDGGYYSTTWSPY